MGRCVYQFSLSSFFPSPTSLFTADWKLKKGGWGAFFRPSRSSLNASPSANISSESAMFADTALFVCLLTRRREYFQDESLFSFLFFSLFFLLQPLPQLWTLLDVQSRLSHHPRENLPVISQLRVKAELLDSSAQQTFAALSWTKVLISFQIRGSLPIRPPALPSCGCTAPPLNTLPVTWHFYPRPPPAAAGSGGRAFSRLVFQRDDLPQTPSETCLSGDKVAGGVGGGG